MAVIRQRTQVFNKPVGVVRGDVGAQQVGQSISNAAAQLSQLAYREAAQQAEDVGRKEAMAQESGKIATLDPITGLPEAYQPPASYGTIATRSYQNMVDRRFEESVLLELEARGKEFAQKSSSADQYNTRFGQYIEQMHSAAEGDTAYTRLIEEAGTKYLASTYATLKKKEEAAARKALQQQSALGRYNENKKLAAMANAGAPADEFYAGTSAARTRLMDELNTSLISMTSFISENEKIDGLESIYSQQELVRVFDGLNDIQRNQLIVGLQNPEQLVALDKSLGSGGELIEMVSSARTQASVPTLVSGFKAYSGAADDMEVSVLDSAVADVLPSIGANTPASQISMAAMRFANETNAELGKQYYKELMSRKLEMNLDQSITDASVDGEVVIQTISNELESTQPNYDNIAKYLTGDKETMIAELKAMNDDQRKSLSEGLSDRLVEVKALASIEDENVFEGFAAQVQQVREGDIYLAPSLIESIKSSSLNPTKQSSLIGSAQAAWSLATRKVASEITPNSSAEMRTVLDAVKAKDSSLIGTEVGQQLYNLYSIAHDADPAATRAIMENRVVAMEANEERVINTSRSLGTQSAMTSGEYISPEDLEHYDEQLFEGKGIAASEIFTNVNVMDSLNKGYVLPSVAKAIEAGVNSNNEQEVMAAAQLFEIYSTLETVTEGGYVANYDIMRNSLKPDAYSRLAAISFTARARGVEPIAIQKALNNYDPISQNIDKDILVDLTGKEDGNIRRILDGKKLSPTYQKEILSSIRVGKALGDRITMDYVDDLIESYSDRASRDPSVVGSSIDDQTVYGVNNFFTARERLSKVGEITDLLIEEGGFGDVLTGGTEADAAISSLLGQGGGIVQLYQKLFNTGDLSGAIKGQDRDRLAEGKKILAAELRYKPIVSSFNMGEPRYYVGFEDGNVFQAIIINDQPLIWEREFDLSSAQAQLRSENYSKFRVTVRSTQDMSKRLEAEVRYLSTLDHFDEATLENLADRKFSKLLPNYKDIYAESRAEYEALGQ